MPLAKGKNNKIISKNIKELESTGKYPHRQAIAIALSEAGKSKPKRQRKCVQRKKLKNRRKKSIWM